MTNNKNKENSTSQKNQTRKEIIKSSFEKAIKANGDALKKLSKN